MATITRITTGYKKKLRGKPCEDFKVASRLKDAIIFAVADGHGDSKCVYAGTGAKIACELMVQLLKEIRKYNKSLSEYAKHLNDNREDIICEFVRRWTKGILTDYLGKISDEEEILKLHYLISYSDTIYKVQEGAFFAKDLRKIYEERHQNNHLIYDISIKYGTTINATVITKEFVFALGLGDGDVVAIEGDNANWLLPKSPQFETKTASLCWKFDKILEYFSTIMLPLVNAKGRKSIIEVSFDPDMIILSTDGLRNSYLSDDAFSKHLVEIAHKCKMKGVNYFSKRAQRWIDEATRYSLYQDDICFCAFISD